MRRFADLQSPEPGLAKCGVCKYSIFFNGKPEVKVSDFMVDVTSRGS